MLSLVWTSAWACYPSSAFTDDAAPGSADAAAVPGYPLLPSGLVYILKGNHFLLFFFYSDRVAQIHRHRLLALALTDHTLWVVLHIHDMLYGTTQRLSIAHLDSVDLLN